MRLNIALLPDARTRGYLGGLAQEIAVKFPLTLAVDNVNFKPHATLYQLNASAENAAHIIQVLQRKSSYTKKIHSETTEPGSGDSNSFDYNVPKKPLLDLQRTILEEVPRFRSEDISTLTHDSTNEEQENVTHFGVRGIRSLYRPHITIGLAKNAKDLPTILELLRSKPAQEFTFTEIALGKIDEYGQITDIIKTFELKN